MRYHDQIPIYIGDTGTNGPDEPSSDSAIAVTVGTIVSVGIFLGAWVFVRALYALITGLLSKGPSTFLYSIVVGLVALFLGALLYFLREKKRAAYAYLELGVGFGTAVEAWLRLSSSSNVATLGFSLLASIYVIVRGIDNLAKAREESRLAKEKRRLSKSAA